MATVIRCANCGKSLGVDPKLVGKKIRCPGCKDVFTLTDEHFGPAKPPVEEQAIQEKPVRKPAPAAPPESIEEPRKRPKPPRVEDDDREDDNSTEDRDEDDDAPRRPKRPVEKQRKLIIPVRVVKDSKGILKGLVKAELDSRGLYLPQKDAEDDVEIPIGESVKHAGSFKIDVRLGKRTLTLAVAKPKTYMTRLARDLAEYLSGNGPPLREEDYALGAGWIVLAALPLMVAVTAISVHSAGKIPKMYGWQGIVWSAVWGGIGGLLGGLAWNLVQRDRVTATSRALGAIGLTVLGFGIYFGALVWANSVWDTDEWHGPPINLNFPGPKIVGNQNDGWQNFSPPGAPFSISMPGVPTTKIEREPKTQITLTVHVLDRRDRNEVYGVFWGEIPAADLARVTAEQRFDASRQGMLANMAGSMLVSEKAINVAGHPGREWEVNLPGRGKLVQRAILAGRRFIVLNAGGTNFTANTPEVQRYFGSFQLK